MPARLRAGEGLAPGEPARHGRRRSEPFFLFLSFLEPHHQNDMQHFVAPDGYAERYAD